MPDCQEREDVDGAEDCALNGRKVDDAEDAPVGGGADLADDAHLNGGAGPNDGAGPNGADHDEGAPANDVRGPIGPIGADIEAAAENAAAVSTVSVRGVIPLWRNRDYGGWWISSLISSLGSAMSQLAYPLL